MSTTEQNKTVDVLVIGGGASGMMAAIVAARNGAKVLLLEKNKRLGEKLRITGGGRCNITNAESDIRLLLRNYGTSEKFLYSAFSRFGVADTITFFDAIGVPTKVEARNRVFPISESAVRVTEALVEALHAAGVTVLTDSAVSKVTMNDSFISAVHTGSAVYKARSIVLATGGTSHPETGATGDGFNWLKGLGHTTRDPSPTITPLAASEKWLSDVAGTTIREAKITFYANGKKSFHASGDILLTHFGISGPTILNAAYRVNELLENGDTVTAVIDCVPHKTEKELDTELQELLLQHPRKSLRNTIRFIAPTGTAQMVKKLLSPQSMLDTNNSELPREHRLLVVQQLKNIPLTITGLMGLDKAVVADGGVTLTEVDTRTMRSKLVSNLFITGDLLDINRPSGGFSLQLCWTTGFIAGSSASQL